MFEIKNTGTVAAPIYASAPTTLVTSTAPMANPHAGLIADANGDLFGTTESGGANGDGTVFEIQNTGTVAAPVYASAPTTLVSFNGSNGQYPDAGLIADANGDLFGTTIGWRGEQLRHGVRDPEHRHGCRASLRQRPDHVGQLQRLQRRNIPAGLIADANGDLFGTTAGGASTGVRHSVRDQEYWYGRCADLRRRPDHAGKLQRLQWRISACRSDRRRQRRSVRHDRIWRFGRRTARCSRSRTLARLLRQSTPAHRPRWSASTAPME